MDMECVGIYGYSREGKMATMAAAFDERITALIPGSTGVGGVVSWRLAGERGGGSHPDPQEWQGAISAIPASLHPMFPRG
jgi:hypothetical protein